MAGERISTVDIDPGRELSTLDDRPIVLCVRQDDIKRVLAECLSAWRTPRWHIAVTLPFALAALLSIVEVWGQWAPMKVAGAYFAIVCAFFGGLTWGRMLRPMPSEDEVRRVADATLIPASCADMIARGRELAHKCERLSEKWRTAEVEADVVAPRFGIIAGESFSRIEEFVNSVAPVQLRTRTESQSLPRTEKKISKVECSRCPNVLEPGDNSVCQVDGSPLCRTCVAEISSRLKGTKYSLLCDSCYEALVAVHKG